VLGVTVTTRARRFDIAWAFFAWFKPAGPIWALFLLTPLVPFLDWLRPAARFQWREVSTSQGEPR